MHTSPRGRTHLYLTAWQLPELRRFVSVLIAWQLLFVTGVCEPVLCSSRVLCNEVDQPFETSDEREIESEFNEQTQLLPARRGHERRRRNKDQLSFCGWGIGTRPRIVRTLSQWQKGFTVVHGFRVSRLC